MKNFNCLPIIKNQNKTFKFQIFDFLLFCNQIYFMINVVKGKKLFNIESVNLNKRIRKKIERTNFETCCYYKVDREDVFDD